MLLAIIILVCSVFTLGFGYFIHPAWTFASSSLLWVITVGLIIFSVGITIAMCYYEWEPISIIIPWGVTAASLVLIMVLALISSPVFNSNRYRDAISIQEASFSDDFDDIANLGDYKLLDLDTARRIGDRVLGSVPNAPWYNVSDEYNLIVYQGKNWRISPLEYRDFFAYLKAKNNGIPGYVIVSVDTMEAQFVKTNHPIMVSPSGRFSQKLSRVLRGQFPGKVFESSFMEIDEEGNPYWITAVVEPKAGVWGAPIGSEFIITDACTGKSELHELNEKPEWLDHIYSLEYLMSRASWKYSYVHGWWNISKTGVNRLTYEYKSAATSDGVPAFYGYNTFVSKDGDVKVITGVTPANKTESNIGFLTVDCSTGEYRYYRIPGAEESSAQAVVEGIIQQMGYQSTFPVMCNVGGEPAYLMNLKDKSGLIQRYGIVNYQNYSQAYVGTTFEETLDGYLKLIGLKTEHAETSDVEPAELFEKQGLILEKYQAEIAGNTNFYYVIDEELYKASININELQVTYKPGDMVYLVYSVKNGMNIVNDIHK